MFWRRRERELAVALLSCVVMVTCDKGAPVATGTAQAAVRSDSARFADLRCLTRQPKDCLTQPVPADEPHGAICATCHDMWQNTASHSARACSGGGCHDDAQELSRFHQTLRPLSLANCTHCHRPHQFRVAGDGRQCSVCHQGGGQKVVWGDTLPAVSFTTASTRSGGPSFWHSDHASLTCAACHGVTDTHGALKVQTLQDCRSCHHAAARSDECLRCHAGNKVLSAPVRVRAVLNIRVGTLNRPQRVLSFEHALHRDYSCTTCHKTEQALPSARNADCSTCHSQHHTATANCRACHERPVRGAHDRNSHLGCAGAGCHTNAPVTIREAPRTRQVCLACHTDRQAHEGGRNCAECHLLENRT